MRNLKTGFMKKKLPSDVDLWLSNDLVNVELTIPGSAATNDAGTALPSSNGTAGSFKSSWFRAQDDTDTSSLEASNTSKDSLNKSSKTGVNRRHIPILLLGALFLILLGCGAGFVTGFVAGKSGKKPEITDSLSLHSGDSDDGATTPVSPTAQDTSSNDESKSPTSGPKGGKTMIPTELKPTSSNSASSTSSPTLPISTDYPTVFPSKISPTLPPTISTKNPTLSPKTLMPTVAFVMPPPTVQVEPKPTRSPVLDICEGPCDSDADCDGNLKCFDGSTAIQRLAPKCPGEEIPGKKLCYEIDDTPAPTNTPTHTPTHTPTYTPIQSPSEPPVIPPTPADTLSLIYAGDNGGPSFPLGMCEGDCDGDYQCDAGYLCFNRDDLEEVPGCEDEGIDGKDYCYQPDSSMSGPMVGHTTHNSAMIWAFQGQRKTMKLSYRHAMQTTTRTVDMHPRGSANNAALVEIRGLRASTKYTYELHVEGTRVAQGEFTTAPQPGPVKFDYLLTSCMNLRDYPEQPVWDAVLERNPAFAMLAGDTIYLNEDDWDEDTGIVSYGRTWIRNMEQRAESHFAKVLRSVPTYSAWDDHEYGANNADRRQPGKENTLKAFKDLWANPYYGVSQITGTFYDYYWGNVHFIVLDNRWYRDQGEGTQLGEKQKLWLYDTLIDSVGVFKVVVNGCDIMERGFDKDIDDIGNFVTNNKISGVILNAGDIHRNEFKIGNYGTWPYKLRQISSSGIARDNWMRPWAMIQVDTTLEDPEIRASFYGADTASDDTIWSNDPNLICSDIREVDRFKESRCTEIIRLSDLTPS